MCSIDPLTVGQGEGSALLNYEEILAYKNTCPVNKAGSIDLPSTSVGIVHGLYDRVVPCENSVRLARKLNCRCARACHMGAPLVLVESTLTTGASYTTSVGSTGLD